MSKKRDIPLVQEIWFRSEIHRLTFGEEKSKAIRTAGPGNNGLLDVITQLLSEKRGPVLVFTESRREAAQQASEYSRRRSRAADGVAIAEQLELFSEPTESSDQLRENAERRVAFHSADLSPQERQVIEQGFIDRKFEVCFATSTLAAGVNFPFQTVVFAKLTYDWGGRAGSRILRSDYRNMSGRAGRLGLHSVGYAVLLPQNEIELEHATQIILPKNDCITSQLVSLSMRRTILTLVASKIVDSLDSIESFWKQTLYWHQVQERSSEKLSLIVRRANEASEWLVKNGMLEQHGRTLVATPLGKATAQTGLLPTTAAGLAALLTTRKDELEAGFAECIPGILYAACSCEEFIGDTPSRFLPYPAKGQDISTAFLSAQRLFTPIDRTNLQLIKSAHGLILYVQGVAERKIAYDTKISTGFLHRLALDVSWIIDGMHRIACVPELGCSQRLGNQLAMLARRVRWGAPAEVLDIMRIAEKHGVPGFGRQRAMVLLASGLATLNDILNSSAEKLLQLLGNERRAKSLVGAISTAIGFTPDRLASTHARVAKELGISEIITACNDGLGADYEIAIGKLLKRISELKITAFDNGKRQNVPDLLVELGGVALLIECKTCIKKPPLINKDEAFAVLQKACDFRGEIHRVTLGKPSFDEHSKIKAQGSPMITLVEHRTFLEVVLRVLSGKASAEQFVDWIKTPGVAEINRMPGEVTSAIS